MLSMIKIKSLKPTLLELFKIYMLHVSEKNEEVLILTAQTAMLHPLFLQRWLEG